MPAFAAAAACRTALAPRPLPPGLPLRSLQVGVPVGMGAPNEPAAVGTRHRYGVIALTADHKKVAVVAPAGGGGPQFPSAPLPREALADRLQNQLETALEVGEKQLGLDLADFLCSQPVVHVSRAQSSEHPDGADFAPECPRIAICPWRCWTPSCWCLLHAGFQPGASRGWLDPVGAWRRS